MALVVKCDVCDKDTDKNHASIILVGMPNWRKHRTWDVCPRCYGGVDRLLQTMRDKERGIIRG